MFDEDRSGAIDEDEFFFALEYLGLKVSDSKQEKYFNKYDADGSGTIDYEEFKNIWLAVRARTCLSQQHLLTVVAPTQQTGNIRQELINRGIEVTKWMSKWYMRRRLREIVEEEELAEVRHLCSQALCSALTRGHRPVCTEENTEARKTVGIMAEGTDGKGSRLESRSDPRRG